MKKTFILTLFMCLMSQFLRAQFVTTDGTQFLRDGKPYYFLGTNLWYGPILGSTTTAADRQRLCTELDSLQALGVDNLRILAGAESGSPEAPRYVEPILEEQPGCLNDSLLAGLDFMLAEMQKRGMLAVIYLTNSWDWSGGWGHYLRATGHGNSPSASGDGWNDYCSYAKQFCQDRAAQQLFLRHCEQIICRTNRYTGRAYKDDPTIMSWQLCNEPRPFARECFEAFAQMIHEQAAFIHHLDPNHLVSTGSEGLIGCGIDERLTEKVFMSDDIDYVNMHLWPANWGWASKQRLFEDLPNTFVEAGKYFDYHERLCQRLRKPLVCEEFGYPRNNNSYDPAMPCEARDGLYTFVFERLKQNVENQGPLAGVNFWGWAGQGRPAHAIDPQWVTGKPLTDEAQTRYTTALARRANDEHPTDYYWHPGDDFLCDPPHEPQGWYSVFSTDTTTIALIRKYAALCK